MLPQVRMAGAPRAEKISGAQLPRAFAPSVKCASFTVRNTPGRAPGHAASFGQVRLRPTLSAHGGLPIANRVARRLFVYIAVVEKEPDSKNLLVICQAVSALPLMLIS